MSRGGRRRAPHGVCSRQFQTWWVRELTVERYYYQSREQLRIHPQGSVRSRADQLALDDKIGNVQAAVMMPSAMRVALAKRQRRREAETIRL